MSEFLTAPSPQLVVDDHLQRRALIHAVESEMLDLPQLEIQTKHYFADGIYAREITIPAGSLLTGKIHKTAHLNIVSKGEITVVTENGPRRITAPCTFIAPPGTKRVGYAHSETVWTTIHATVETDLDKIEQLVIADDYPALMDQPLELEKCLG